MGRNVWRNRFSFVGGLLIWIVVALTFFASKTDGGLSEFIVMGTVMSAFCYGVSVWSMFPRVKLTPAALILRNPGTELIVPWDSVKGVDHQHGLRVDIRGMREPFYPAAFQWSIIGAVFGQPRARKTSEAIERWRETYASTDRSEAVVDRFPWQAHLRCFLTGWAIVTVVMPFLGAVGTYADPLVKCDPGKQFAAVPQQVHRAASTRTLLDIQRREQVGRRHCPWLVPPPSG